MNSSEQYELYYVGSQSSVAHVLNNKPSDKSSQEKLYACRRQSYKGICLTPSTEVGVTITVASGS